MDSKETFFVDFSVRDYECDMNGIVNNAVYLNYIEHARHEYLKSLNINFAQLAKQGVNLVITRTEIDYRSPLVCGNTFYVTAAMERLSKNRFQFSQNIYKYPDHNVVLEAIFKATGVNKKGRPEIPENLIKLLPDEMQCYEE